jgi:transglutaminase-like putative cysteine protease
LKLEVASRIRFHALWPSPVVLILSPQSGDGQNVISEEVTIEPSARVREFVDTFGNLCHRLVMPKGDSDVEVHAVVETADYIDVDMTAPLTPMDQVPDYVLEFCLPSRYCQSDMLGTFTRGVVGDALPGYPQVEAIRSWIESSMRYEYGVSTVSTSVLETLQHRAGVCRDFAHLGIAMCRAIDIPARMVVGYLHELIPMDHHAWFEAYVGGRWFTFDATQRFPRGNRVAVAYGRDAADVAIATQYGSLDLLEMTVSVTPFSDRA